METKRKRNENLLTLMRMFPLIDDVTARSGTSSALSNSGHIRSSASCSFTPGRPLAVKSTGAIRASSFSSVTNAVCGTTIPARLPIGKLRKQCVDWSCETIWIDHGGESSKRRTHQSIAQNVSNSFQVRPIYRCHTGCAFRASRSLW